MTYDNSLGSPVCKRGHDVNRVGRASNGQCRACKALNDKARHEANPEVGRARSRAHYEANKAEYIDRAAAWAAENPEKVKEAKRTFLRKTYGARSPDGERRVGPCEVCGDHADPLMWDHDHVTTEFRGWLCRVCNSGLGMFKDSPERMQKAIAYLNRAR